MNVAIQIMTTGSRFTFIAKNNDTGEEFKDSDYFEGIDYSSRNKAFDAGFAFAKRKQAGK